MEQANNELIERTTTGQHSEISSNNSGWISVNNQFPGTEAVYLAFFQTPVDTYIETVYFMDGKFLLPGRGQSKFITHWMELPSLPPGLQNKS